MKQYREVEPGELSQTDLKCYIAGFEEFAPRTTALQNQISIGVGYNEAWYRSFKECWLGWLTAKDCELRIEGRDPCCAAAEIRWQHLLNSPLMFWVAESANMPEPSLTAAETAARTAAEANPKSGHPHGKLMRQALPWNEVEQAILNGMRPVDRSEAEELGLVAFRYLCQKRPEFRKLTSGLPGLS